MRRSLVDLLGCVAIREMARSTGKGHAVSVSAALRTEAKQIRRVLRCARSALKANPKNREAEKCLKFGVAKLRLVKEIERRHKGL
jgi:hypothetical protein